MMPTCSSSIQFLFTIFCIYVSIFEYFYFIMIQMLFSFFQIQCQIYFLSLSNLEKKLSQEPGSVTDSLLFDIRLNLDTESLCESRPFGQRILLLLQFYFSTSLCYSSYTFAEIEAYCKLQLIDSFILLVLNYFYFY